MSLFVLIAVPAAALALSVKLGEDGFDTVPFVTSAAILVMYVLSFFKALHAAGFIACGVIVFSAVVLVREWLRGRRMDSGRGGCPVDGHSGVCGGAAGERAEVAACGIDGGAARSRSEVSDFRSCGDAVRSPFGKSAFGIRGGAVRARFDVSVAQLVLAFVLMGVAAVLASGRVVTWWDDINFWANDAKALWALGGFPGKYGNVSPEFGDYPPVQSLWKWVFLSLSPNEYREGLQYSAYHVLNMIYLLPLLKATRDWGQSACSSDGGASGARRVLAAAARLVAVPVVFLLPGIVCGLQFGGAAADVTMGCVYGALLLAIAEGRGRAWHATRERGGTRGDGSLQGAVDLMKTAGALGGDTLRVAQKDGDSSGADGTCEASGVSREDANSSNAGISRDATSVSGADAFRAARIAVYASVLMLSKSTGFIWWGFALLFWLLTLRWKKDAQKADNAAMHSAEKAQVGLSGPAAKRVQGFRLRMFIIEALPAVISLGFFLSWLLFCIVNHRFAKLTGEAVRLTKAGLPMPDNAAEKLRVFAEAFFLWPMHDDRNLTLDLSAGAMLGIILISIVILWRLLRRGYDVSNSEPEDATSVDVSSVDGAVAIGDDVADADTDDDGSIADLPLSRILSFFIITAVGIYVMIMLTHLSIFSVEDQYLDPFAMARSISRYGAPFTIGALMLLLNEAGRVKLSDGRAADSTGKRSRALMPFCAAALFLLLPLLTADYAGELRAFVSYRETRAEDLRIREETIDPAGRQFLAEIASREDLYGRRVLLLRDGDMNHRVKDTYISYEASPVSVVYADWYPDMSEEDVQNEADRLHAEFIFR